MPAKLRLLAIVLSASAALLTTTPASAASRGLVHPLDPCGGVDSYTTWSSVAKPWVVTHATRYEHYTTGVDTRTYQASEQTQLTAAVTFSTKGTLSANAAIVSLGGQVNASLALTGQKTVSGSVSVTSTMNNYAAYVFYRGDHKATGAFTYYVCGSTGHSFVVNSRGNAASWDVPTSGALDCSTNPPSSSLGYVVKPRFC